MRELKSASCRWLDVSSVEWLNFVEDALHNGFHSIAEKVYIHIDFIERVPCVCNITLVS